MAKIRSMNIPGAPRPNLESLVRHFDRYGLSEKEGYRGKKKPYKTYKMLAKDPLVEVAFDYLGENAYVHFIETIGYSHFAEEARADWKDERTEDK